MSTTNFVKYTSYILAFILFAALIFSIVVGEDKISSFLNFDITNISISRDSNTYQFSLVDKFPIIALATLLIIASLIAIGRNAEQFKRLVCNAFSFFKRYTIQSWREIKVSNIKYILIIPFLLCTYLAYTFPAHLDEAMTYMHFVKPPMWEAICFYPAPNNHIFHSILVNITEHIPFLDLSFRMRMPALLATFLTSIIAYRFIKKYYSEKVAIFVVAIGSLLVTNVEYSYMSRGYSLITLFTVVVIYCAFNIIHQGNKHRDWCIFTLASILGAFTIPTFLYPFVTVSVYILIYNYKNIKTQIFYSALVAIGVFLAYTPLLIFSGIESLYDNEYVSSIDRFHVLESIPGYFIGVFVNIFCTPNYIILGLLALAILNVAIKKDKRTAILWAVFIIIPAICLLLHSVLPFFRVFFYYGFILAFLAGISFKNIIDQCSLKYLTLGLLATQVLLSVHFFHNINYLQSDSIVNRKICDEIVGNNKSYYLKYHLLTDMLSANLIYEAARKDCLIAVTVGEEANMDKNAHYDYALVLNDEDSTKLLTPHKEMPTFFGHPIVIYKK